jgi:MSHA biogenesis protein MshJ
VSTSLRVSLNNIAERIDAFNLRERGFIFVAIMAVLFLVADNLLFPPLRAEQKKLEQAVAAKLAQNRTLSAQIEQFIKERGSDPNVVTRYRIADLRKQLGAMEGSMTEITRGLVAPKEMIRLVREVLVRNRPLRVMRLQNLPPEPLVAQGESQSGQQTGASSAKPRPVAYRHGMQIEVQGTYPEIVRYLRALEALRWKVFWDKVRLEAEHYPVSRLTLVIYTLSLDKAWIGT